MDAMQARSALLISIRSIWRASFRRRLATTNSIITWAVGSYVPVYWPENTELAIAVAMRKGLTTSSLSPRNLPTSGLSIWCVA